MTSKTCARVPWLQYPQGLRDAQSSASAFEQTFGRRKTPTAGFVSAFLFKFRALYRIVLHGIGKDGRVDNTWRTRAVKQLARSLAAGQLPKGKKGGGGGGGGLRPKTSRVNRKLNQDKVARNYAPMPRAQFAPRRKELRMNTMRWVETLGI